jgi:hypothetical protein
LPEEKIRRRYAQIAAAAQLKPTRMRIGHPRAVLYGDMKKLKTGASRNSSSDARRSLLLAFATCQIPILLSNHVLLSKTFAVAISAETDHFDAAMILEHKGYSIEAFATPTMTWSEAEQEKYRLLGPYESFQSRTDAEAWEPLSSC